MIRYCRVIPGVKGTCPRRQTIVTNGTVSRCEKSPGRVALGEMHGCGAEALTRRDIRLALTSSGG